MIWLFLFICAVMASTLSEILKAQIEIQASKPLDASELLTLEKTLIISEVALLRQLFRDIHSALRPLPLPALSSPQPSEPDCGSFLQCNDCFEAGCAWCLGERVCVKDDVWMCQGQEDQVGKKVGAVKQCPTPEEIEQKRKNNQRESDEVQGPKPGGTIVEEGLEGDCISWRQTGNCDPNGPREQQNDRLCNVLVPADASGFCECKGGDTAHSNCQHDPFTCDAECKKLPTLRLAAAKQARERLETRKREELERIRAESQIESATCGQSQEQTCGESLSDKSDSENEEKRLLQEEIKARAAMAKSGNGGSQNPYKILGVSEDAAPKEIQKAYRRLSLLLHPDKNLDMLEEAADAFADLVVAYEILNDPDKRTAFDEMGNHEGFQTQWEYEQYGKKGSRGFYTGHPLITTLTEKLWNRRVTGTSIWLVEFYAAWCTHCQTFVPTFKALAESLRDTNIEVGAVNCESEIHMCQQMFNIRAYPTIRMISKYHGTQQEFLEPNKDIPTLTQWAKDVSVEWTWLFGHANLIELNSQTFSNEVLSSPEFWVIGFLDGLECGPCKTAKTNILRLSAGLRGVAQVGMINCEDVQNRQFCQELGLPEPPHNPQVWAWKHGPKTTGTGEMLYNPNEIEPHRALQLIERVVRLARASDIPENAVSLGKEAKWDEGQKEQPPPPRPSPMWNGPKGREPLRVIENSRVVRQQIGG